MTAIYTTTHEGNTASRKSAGHIEPLYKFAVWVKSEANVWSCECYSSRVDLAQARARDFRTFGWAREVVIAPVTCEIKLTKRQQAFVASRQPSKQEG